MPPNSRLPNRFSPDTMSGVQPGRRTARHQRLRVRADGEQPEVEWMELQWHADSGSVCLLQLGEDPGEDTSVWRQAPPPSEQIFVAELAAVLADRGRHAEACFACTFFRTRPGLSSGGLPIGRCTWKQHDSATSAELPDVISTQSALALACDQFRFSSRPPDPAVEEGDEGVIAWPRHSERKLDQLSVWSRLWQRISGRSQEPSDQGWAETLVERSGVAPGTEPCLLCHGRLANLGALVASTSHDDTETFSLWRCRTCYCLFLSDWVDRWERLDALETEEAIYRLAPAEASAALAIMRAVAGAGHSAGRAAGRRGLQAQMRGLIDDRTPLTHQRRYGR